MREERAKRERHEATAKEREKPPRREEGEKTQEERKDGLVVKD